MSANSGTAAVRTARSPEVIVNFDPTRVAAPISLRCGALIIDYILVVVAPISMMILGRYFGNDGTRLVAGGLNDTGWLIAVIVAFANFIVLPIFSGRSIGKVMTGLTIVGIDGKPAGTIKMILRQTLGYSIALITLGGSLLVSVLNSRGRSLHDFLFGTIVIFGKRKYK